ncbi:MAG: hypothetical protein EOP60_11290 [Sphingomonadales bacterium]|nr:MAG: hypothetical protein EOP60_11290 [Sphingomonadales bacterium]
MTPQALILARTNLMKALLAQAAPLAILYVMAKILLRGQSLLEITMISAERRGWPFVILGLAALVIWIVRYSLPGLLALMSGADLTATGQGIEIRGVSLPWAAISSVRLVSSPFRKGVMIEADKTRYFFDTILSEETPTKLLDRIALAMRPITIECRLAKP